VTREGGSERESIKILLEGDSNSNKMNSLGRTPKVTCSALLPSVFQNHVATEVLLILGTNTTSSLDSYMHTATETTREPAVWRRRYDRVWGAVRPPPPGDREILQNSSSKHQNTSRFHQISDQGQAGYQEILVKTKTSPKGLGVVRPATRGGLTSCTQQITPSKNS
jgi:hypothetical protein